VAQGVGPEFKLQYLKKEKKKPKKQANTYFQKLVPLSPEKCDFKSRGVAQW
jgi:hypothetical protein